MGVKITGGVHLAGSGKSLGQPSAVPGVRQDVQGFAVSFDRDLFTQSIKTHGSDVIWEKASLCPDVAGPNPKDHNINCKRCHNRFIYFDPQPTQMLVMSMSINQQYLAYGRLDSGRASITAYPEFKMSFWDRITLCKSRLRYNEFVKRQRNTMRDKTKYAPLCVRYLAWADGASKQGVDFTVDETTSEIVFTSNNRPGADVWYTIVYEFHPQFIVMDLPHMIRDEPIPTLNGTEKSYEFPIQAIAQLDQFVRDEGLDASNESDTRNPFPAKGAPFAADS